MPFRRTDLISALLALTAMQTAFVSPASAQTPMDYQQRSAAWSVFGYDPGPDFVAYDPKYRDKISQYKDRLEQLRQQMFKEASAGRKTTCSRQVYVELKWLIQNTARYDQIEKRMQDLQAILAQPSDPMEGMDQSPVDGSFSPCNQLWFYKVDVACDNLVVMQYLDAKPKYPLRFLDDINSPAKYRAYMDGLLISDVRKTGVNNAFELNLAGTDLVRLINGTLPSGYKFDPALKSAVLDYLDNKWQDPQTGYWGAWYRTKDGNIRKTADMSATFHIIHYRQGKVNHWPEIIKTTLAMKDLEWPYGWLQDGQMSDHHNYDVVTVFHYGWEYMTPSQKSEAKAEIQRMLDFCLTKSLRPDGSFNLNDEDTIGEAFEFPCLFLYEIGFFNKENRYWTDQNFPQAHQIAQRIDKKIKALKLDDPESAVAQIIVESAD